jgi:hypothetical protein
MHLRRHLQTRLLVIAALALAALTAAPTPGADALEPVESQLEPTSAGIGNPNRVASPRTGRSPRCKPSIEVSSQEITAGETVTVSGTLACGEAEAAADQEVTLYQRTPGSGVPGMLAVASTTTAADGSYQITPPVFTQSSILLVRTQRAHSPRLHVVVASHISLTASFGGTPLSLGGAGTPLAARSVVTFSGTVTPVSSNMIAVLQRERPNGSGNWRRVANAAVGPNASYSIAHSFRRAGEANLRILVRARGLVVGASDVVSYQIVARQNPRLLIQTSSTPITFGASVEISGVAAGALNAPVELQARTGGGAFTVVASGVTDGAGNYSFAQSPASNTVYRVRDAHTQSVALSVPVRYALSAAPATGLVHAGEPLTLSGTVAPAPPGTSVYLDRGNPSGTEFHPVAMGTVGTDGTYTLSYTFPRALSRTFRIRVSGGPANALATSALFAIQVVPAPAAGAQSAEL